MENESNVTGLENLVTETLMRQALADILEVQASRARIRLKQEKSENQLLHRVLATSAVMACLIYVF